MAKPRPEESRLQRKATLPHLETTGLPSAAGRARVRPRASVFPLRIRRYDKPWHPDFRPFHTWAARAIHRPHLRHDALHLDLRRDRRPVRVELRRQGILRCLKPCLSAVHDARRARVHVRHGGTAPVAKTMGEGDDRAPAGCSRLSCMRRSSWNRVRIVVFVAESGPSPVR